MEHALLSDASNTVMFENGYDCGLLIAFEGPDGSGKTTQRKLFKSWLQSIYDDVVVTKWNSSPLFKPLIKAKKTARMLDPGSYGILHAADFWHRYEAVIEPALAEGKVVLADRYIFTGLARDVARGMSPDWCQQLYSGVRKPDIVFYFNASVDTCAMRITASRPLKFYEAGQDVTGMDDAYQSYLCFGQRVVTEYERLHKQFGFVIVDADKSVYEQHRFIRETYLKLCSTAPATPSWKPQLNAFLTGIDV
jgi:dTMP kinase